ncbi:MAG: lysine exporter LysO family protein [Clostridia bacterium]|nr:lysine exporter LysO family protein [Clostridia bacterium]
MTLKITVFLILGVLTGRIFSDFEYISYLDQIVNIGLYILLFFVGIDIGKSKQVFVKIRDVGWRIILLPLAIAIGSIVGAGLAGIFVKMPFNESGAVGAGFGWYTLSSIIISDIYSERLSTVAFLANIFREVIAILIIPIICRKVGKIESIAPAGATAMDTTLPIITRNAGAEAAVLSFVTGALLSFIVPVVVPLLIKL